jgi:hypothetical protein
VRPAATVRRVHTREAIGAELELSHQDRGVAATAAREWRPRAHRTARGRSVEARRARAAPSLQGVRRPKPGGEGSRKRFACCRSPMSGASKPLYEHVMTKLVAGGQVAETARSGQRRTARRSRSETLPSHPTIATAVVAMVARGTTTRRSGGGSVGRDGLLRAPINSRVDRSNWRILRKNCGSRPLPSARFGLFRP